MALEEFRQQQRQRTLFHRNLQIACHECAAATNDQVSVEQRELAEQLGSALENLSSRQREVLHLTFYENMTIEQAAKILEISMDQPGNITTAEKSRCVTSFPQIRSSSDDRR